MSTTVPLSVAPAPARPSADRRQARAFALALARGLAGVAAVLAATLAGIGWLYTLRKAGALDAGPRLHEALPLQRLAGGADQPALRLVAAWLPTGVVVGLALRSIGFRRAPIRAGWTLALTAVLLLAAGAAADAVTASESLGAHVAAQPGRAAIWVAAALAAAGAALPRTRAR